MNFSQLYEQFAALEDPGLLADRLYELLPGLV